MRLRRPLAALAIFLFFAGCSLEARREALFLSLFKFALNTASQEAIRQAPRPECALQSVTPRCKLKLQQRAHPQSPAST